MAKNPICYLGSVNAKKTRCSLLVWARQRGHSITRNGCKPQLAEYLAYYASEHNVFTHLVILALLSVLFVNFMVFLQLLTP